MKREGRIFCKRCWYDLRGVVTNHCPECGKHFNPDFPQTFVKTDGNKLPSEIWVVLGIHGAAWALYLIAMLLAWFNAGDYSIATPEVVAFGMFCSSLPLIVIAAFCGVCVSLFQAKSVKPNRRLLLHTITLSPSLVVVACVIYMVLHHD